MAFAAAGLVNQTGMPQGRGQYAYHTTDLGDVVEAANYFNNLTNVLGLAKGDFIRVFTWSATIFAAGSTINQVKDFVVTNVIANDAASSAGAVNIAEVGIQSGGLLSSLA